MDFIREGGRRARLLARLQSLGLQAGVAAELLRLDRQALRSWSEQVGAVRAALGPQVAEVYTDLVLQGARHDVGAQVAREVPDHVARVADAERLEYLRLLGVVLRQSPSAVGLVARALPQLMERLEGPALGRFIESGLTMHDLDAGRAEVFLRGESKASQQELSRLETGLALSDVSRTLALYARAHCGEDVQIKAVPGRQGRQAWSEGRHLHLPERVDRYGDERDFTVYRVMAARTAATLEFGSFELKLREVPGQWVEPFEGESELERLYRSFPNRSLARDLFQICEDWRLERCMVAEYPGLQRDLDTLRPEELAERPPAHSLPPVQAVVEGLLQKSMGRVEALEDAALEAEVQALWARVEPLTHSSTVEDSAGLLAGLYAQAEGHLRKVADEPPPQERERKKGGKRPQRPSPDDAPGESQAQMAYKGLDPKGMGAALRPEALGDEERWEDAQARELQEQMSEEGLEASLREIRRAMRQELGADERSYEEMVAWLERNPPPEGGLVEQGRERPPVEREARHGGLPLDPDADPRAKSTLQPEWDEKLGDYKPAWVKVKEHRLEPGSGEFVQAVLDEYGAQIRLLRRRFSALRPEQMRRVRGVTDGEELDFDRVIEARVERRAGVTPSDRIYSRQVRKQRDVAVAFVVDLSSSTNEVAGMAGKRIIQVEKEALVMIAEAVDAIGDACGIYGFSGYGRDHVAFYVAKDFSDPYDDAARRRIGRMTHKMENRDGAAIRYATSKLLAQPATTRLLVLLSDGRPLDCGCERYFDAYAQADTKVALREARQKGVHPFCITVDPRARSYLEQMYGEVGYVVIEDAETLPRRLPAIYRRLTR